MSETPSALRPPASGRRTLWGSAIGIFVEWYDFIIYAVSAPTLATLFFPDSNPAAALLGTFAIYAVAFVVRPLGGLFFGGRGDRRGRRHVMSTTVLLMGGATMLSGLLPTYDQIGLWAAMLLLGCRLVQGFSAGGEAPGATSFVLESAPHGQRGRWIGITIAASFLPGAIAGLFVLALRLGLGEDAYLAWGWRIPFLVGGLLAVIGLWIRRALRDPHAYTATIAAEGVATAPLRTVGRAHYKAMLTVCFLIAVQGVGGYMLNSYMYSFHTTVVGLGAVPALVTNAVALLVIVGLLPILGELSDRVGRRPMMAAGAAWLAVLAFPAFLLSRTGTVAGAMAGQLVLAVGVSLFAAGGFLTVLELFPTQLRVSGLGISYNVGYAVFGGTTPLVASTLVTVLGSPMAPAAYLLAICLVGLVVVKLTPETKGWALMSPQSQTHEEVAR